MLKNIGFMPKGYHQPQARDIYMFVEGATEGCEGAFRLSKTLSS